MTSRKPLSVACVSKVPRLHQNIISVLEYHHSMMTYDNMYSNMLPQILINFGNIFLRNSITTTDNLSIFLLAIVMNPTMSWFVMTKLVPVS